MGPTVKRFAASVGLILVISLSITIPASALSVELAKQCREMAIKAHPMTLPGVKTGNAQAQRDDYRACIANNGIMPDNNTQRTTDPTAK
jgi:hypothetical protein